MLTVREIRCESGAVPATVNLRKDDESECLPLRHSIGLPAEDGRNLILDNLDTEPGLFICFCLRSADRRIGALK